MSVKDFMILNIKRGLQGAIIFFIISAFIQYIELRYELLFSLSCGLIIGLILGLIYYRLRVNSLFVFGLINCIVVFICITTSTAIASFIFKGVLNLSIDELLSIATRTVLIMVPITYMFNYRSTKLNKLLRMKQKEY